MCNHESFPKLQTMKHFVPFEFNRFNQYNVSAEPTRVAERAYVMYLADPSVLNSSLAMSMSSIYFVAFFQTSSYQLKHYNYYEGYQAV